jgi:hypothetical protein
LGDRVRNLSAYGLVDLLREIGPSLLKSLVESMPQRVTAVLAAKGRHTKYRLQDMLVRIRRLYFDNIKNVALKLADILGSNILHRT